MDALIIVLGIGLFWIACGAFAMGRSAFTKTYEDFERFWVFLGGPISIIMQQFYRAGKGNDR